MYIFKQPGIGGEVTCHQDATFLYTEPLSVVGPVVRARGRDDRERLPVGPARRPSRAAAQPLPARPGDGLFLETIDAAAWPDADAVPLPARRGSLIVLHGLLPHLSGANRSAALAPRLTLHVIDGTPAIPRTTGCSGRRSCRCADS